MVDPPRISLAAKVPRSKGEETRKRLRELGLLRLELKPHTEGAWLLVPVVDRAREAFLGFEWTTATFEAQTPPPPTYQALAEVPESLRELLPSSFDVVGAIILLKLPDELIPHKSEVGRALLAAHKGARTVLLDHGVQGRERVRQVEVIAGEPTTVAEHQEHGARIKADLATSYFSPRLATEHARVAGLVGRGEVVLDMFAGVGPFSILIARGGLAARVYAVDINPEAVRWIEENARLNKVQDKVRPVLADVAAFAWTIAGQCDRVIMGLPHSADEHWEQALVACRAERAVVHYYRMWERDTIARHVTELVERAAAAGWDARPVAQREVRLYSPSQSHFAVDFELRKRNTA